MSSPDYEQALDEIDRLRKERDDALRDLTKLSGEITTLAAEKRDLRDALQGLVAADVSLDLAVKAQADGIWGATQLRQEGLEVSRDRAEDAWAAEAERKRAAAPRLHKLIGDVCGVAYSDSIGDHGKALLIGILVSLQQLAQAGREIGDKDEAETRALVRRTLEAGK